MKRIKKMPYYVFMLIFFFLSACKVSEIKYIEVEYLPQALNTLHPIDCDMINDGFGDIKTSKKKISSQKFLMKFEDEYLNIIPFEDTTPIDIRIKMRIFFKNNRVDKLCVGEFFGVVKNGLIQKNNEKIIEMIKDEVKYYKSDFDE